MHDFDDLVAALADGGDPARQDAAWETIHGLILMYARSLMGSGIREDVESVDLVDSVLESFVQELREGRLAFAGKAELVAYLRRVTAHKVVDFGRRCGAAKRGGGVLHHPVGTDGEAGEIEPVDGGETAATRVGREDALEHLAKALPEGDRSFLALLREGLGVAEIARRLGITVEAARKRYQRLRDRVREAPGAADAGAP